MTENYGDEEIVRQLNLYKKGFMELFMMVYI